MFGRCRSLTRYPSCCNFNCSPTLLALQKNLLSDTKCEPYQSSLFVEMTYPFLGNLKRLFYLASFIASCNTTVKIMINFDGLQWPQYGAQNYRWKRNSSPKIIITSELVKYFEYSAAVRPHWYGRPQMSAYANKCIDNSVWTNQITNMVGFTSSSFLLCYETAAVCWEMWGGKLFL